MTRDASLIFWAVMTALMTALVLGWLLWEALTRCS